MKVLPTLLFCFAISCGLTAAESAPGSVVELFATPDNVRIVRAGDRADACLLQFVAPPPHADGSVDRSAGTYTESEFVAISPEVTRTLRELLLSTKTYDWKAGDGGRRPRFYVRLRFHQGEEAVNVDFCFQCHVLNVTRNGEELGHANFAPNADLMLQALRKVFPHDEALRKVASEAGLPP